MKKKIVLISIIAVIVILGGMTLAISSRTKDNTKQVAEIENTAETEVANDEVNNTEQADKEETEEQKEEIKEDEKQETLTQNKVAEKTQQKQTTTSNKTVSKKPTTSTKKSTNDDNNSKQQTASKTETTVTEQKEETKETEVKEQVEEKPKAPAEEWKYNSTQENLLKSLIAKETSAEIIKGQSGIINIASFFTAVKGVDNITLVVSNRLSGVIPYVGDTIRIYARDYYKNGNYVWTEFYVI